MLWAILIAIVLVLGSVLAVATEVDSGGSNHNVPTATPSELTVTPEPTHIKGTPTEPRPTFNSPTVTPEVVEITATPEPTLEPTPEPTNVIELSPTPADLPETGGKQ